METATKRKGRTAPPKEVQQELQPVVRTLPPMQLVVDISRFEMGDILLLDDIANDRPYNLIEAMRMLDRVVEGGIKNGRPINQFKPLIGQCLAILQEIANPK